MRKLAIIGALASSLLLTSCATPGKDNSVLIQQIREAAIAVCGFLPEVATVAAILSSGNPIVATVSGVANAICAAVTSPETRALGPRRAPPVVAGVVIHGKFVRR